MFQKLIITLLIFMFTILSSQKVPFAVPYAYSSNEHLLGKQQMSLENRHPVSMNNAVYKDNILLTLSYLSGSVTKATDIDWDNVRAFTYYEFELQPGEVFAYHDGVRIEYQDEVVKTTNANFNSEDGFKSDGYLMGNGVCHLASLINWAAKDAGLHVFAPTNHNFAVIPEVPSDYGTSIYYTPGNTSGNGQQNLYIKNTHTEPVRFVFRYNQEDLSLTIYK